MRYELKVSFPLTRGVVEFYKCSRCSKYEQKLKRTNDAANQTNNRKPRKEDGIGISQKDEVTK